MAHGGLLRNNGPLLSPDATVQRAELLQQHVVGDIGFHVRASRRYMTELQRLFGSLGSSALSLGG